MKNIPSTDIVQRLQPIIVRLLTNTKADIQKRHRDAGQVATGKTSNMMSVKQTQEGADLIGWKYTDTYEVGRAPGRMPEINKILEWIQAKHLNFDKTPQQVEHYAYCIAYKIAREGTKRYRDVPKPDIFTTPIKNLEAKLERQTADMAELQFESLLLHTDPNRDA